VGSIQTGRGRTDLSGPTVRQLLKLHREILAELRRRSVVRSGNAPAGDYAEWLVARATKGELEPQSNRSWDVTARNGDHLQVKARIVTDPHSKGQRQLSVFRSWKFDGLVIVLFDDSCRVSRATFLEHGDARKAKRYWSSHVNGDVLYATDEMLDLGEDWTGDLRRAAR
jgi:hypothetical protein